VPGPTTFTCRGMRDGAAREAVTAAPKVAKALEAAAKATKKAAGRATKSQAAPKTYSAGTSASATTRVLASALSRDRRHTCALPPHAICVFR